MYWAVCPGTGHCGRGWEDQFISQTRWARAVLDVISMTTIVFLIGAVWMSGALVFCLAICKAASRQLPEATSRDVAPAGAVTEHAEMCLSK